MGRLVDWRYVLPRLAALLVLLLVGQFVLGRAVRRSVIRSGERSVGAKVEVGAAQLSLLGSEVTFCDLRVANPRAPLRNLVEADCCNLEFAPGSLLHRRVVIDRGTISGLRFGTSRESSGALDGAQPSETAPPVGWLDEQSTELARAWLERLQTQFDRDLVDELQSIQLTERLVSRWPEQASSLEDRVHKLRQRTIKFQEQVREAQANPLRHTEFLERMPDEIDEIQRVVAEVTRNIQNLPDMLDADRRAIVAARKHDEQLLRGELHFDKLEANVLTAYLLGQQMSGPVADLLGWLRWIRRVVPAESSPVAAPHRRGRHVAFRGCTPAPDWVVRSLGVRGTARVGGQPFELLGTLTDLSSDPALHDQPMRLRLTACGSMALELQATIDRTGQVPRDELVVDCGGILIPKLRLGGSNKLRFSIKPTTASLNVRILLEGDRLSGETSVRITSRSPATRFSTVAERLSLSPKRISSVATVSFSFTMGTTPSSKSSFSVWRALRKRSRLSSPARVTRTWATRRPWFAKRSR